MISCMAYSLIYEEFSCREDCSSCIREVVGQKASLVTRYLD